MNLLLTISKHLNRVQKVVCTNFGGECQTQLKRPQYNFNELKHLKHFKNCWQADINKTSHLILFYFGNTKTFAVNSDIFSNKFDRVLKTPRRIEDLFGIFDTLNQRNGQIRRENASCTNKEMIFSYTCSCENKMTLRILKPIS